MHNDFSGITVLFLNGTLKKSPQASNTEALMEASAQLMRKLGASAEIVRTVDLPIAQGVMPDMREAGWDEDAWPELYKKVEAADVVVVGGPIWLGDISSEIKKLIERLDAHSGDTNDKRQYVYYGKVGGALITGNEDGLKHSTAYILFALQHMGFTIPPGVDAGWIGKIGPGPSYLDEGSGGPETDFTNRNVTFMTYNLLHMAKLLKDRGGFPVGGNQADKWEAGERFGFEPPKQA